MGELTGDPRAERAVTVLVDNEHPVTFRSPEDTILAYAESGAHFRHQRDWERALAVYSAMKDRLDLAFLVAEADRRGQRDVIDRILRMEPLRRPP